MVRLSIPAAMLALAVSCTVAVLPARAQETLRIAAVVNDDIISAYDLAARIEFQLLTSGERPTPDLRRRIAPQVLRQLIDERLQTQEAKAQNITVTDADVDGLVKDIEENNKLRPGALRQMIQDMGLPADTMTNQLRARILWQKTVASKLRSQAYASEEEVDEQLAIMRANEGKPEYQVSEIFLAVDNPANEADVRTKADRVVAQLRQGASFPVMAQQFSDSAAAAAEGDLGWVYDGQLEPAQNEAIKKLSVGQISDPIRTLSGFHILLLRDRRIASGADPRAVKVHLNQLYLPVPAGSPASAYEAQRQLAQTIAENVQGCPDFAKAARESGQTLPPDIGTRALAELTPDIRDAVSVLAVGTPSAPIQDPTGVRILMVCEREGDQGGQPVREDIRRRMFVERLDLQGRRYLRDLRQAAYVDIRQ